AGEANAERLEALENLDGELGVLHNQGLGELQLEGSLGDVLTTQKCANLIDEVGVEELARRNIDGNEQRLVGAKGTLPYAELARRLVQNMMAEVLDDPGFLSDAHEDVGAKQSLGAMTPSHQRFETGELHVGEA